jgi:hypothetical protein
MESRVGGRGAIEGGGSACCVGGENEVDDGRGMPTNAQPAQQRCPGVSGVL